MWDVALRPSRDALQRATDRHGRFASLAVAFGSYGPQVSWCAARTDPQWVLVVRAAR